MTTNVAVIDIGKTNAKLALVGPDLSEIAILTRPNAVQSGPPYPHFDVEGHWTFILDGLAMFGKEHGISAVSITTHGAAGALLAEDGTLAAPILDYEHTGPETVAADYDVLRPPFSETGSARLAMGLNLGAQLHWQFAIDPGLKARVHRVVTYPQFWAHRLTGVYATDVTSLGCHTDLWNPYGSGFSSLVESLGLDGKIAEPRMPGDVLGPILPEIARQTGLPADTPVLCGIHDSNASLLPHLIERAAPFTVVSTGTWVIAMAVRAEQVTLPQTLDTLINVSARGEPIPSARFMGGREHDLALVGAPTVPTDADIDQVLRDGTMLLPSLAPETGPYPGREACWLGGEPLVGSGTRAAAVAFYLAMVTARCLDLIGHRGPVIVEGPFARNSLYLAMLGVASSSPVIPMASATGTSQGAALLHKDAPSPEPQAPPADLEPGLSGRFQDYALLWRQRVG